jgi:Glycoside-hydrolase family GH114
MPRRAYARWAGALALFVAPPVHALFSYQIGGAFSPQPGIGIVDRDRHDAAVAGLYNVCYVNAFQSQADEHRWWLTRHRDLLLFRRGHPVIDGAWNEQLLDTSTAHKRAALARILGGWMAGCARAGFKAVEPDNLDSWSRSQGALTVHDNLALAASLVRRAHVLGLAIAQKNAAEISATGRRIGFDFAIAEECQAYAECGSYTRVYGRHVIEIEYPDNGGRAGFAAACRARGSRISIVYRDRNVTAAGQRGFIEQHC